MHIKNMGEDNANYMNLIKHEFKEENKEIMRDLANNMKINIVR